MPTVRDINNLVIKYQETHDPADAEALQQMIAKTPTAEKAKIVIPKVEAQEESGPAVEVFDAGRKPKSEEEIPKAEIAETQISPVAPEIQQAQQEVATTVEELPEVVAEETALETPPEIAPANKADLHSQAVATKEDIGTTEAAKLEADIFDPLEE